MSELLTLAAPPSIELLSELSNNLYLFDQPDTWPRDMIEAYDRPPGPYTIENAEDLLDQQAVELYNGWLVKQARTDTTERRIVANINDVLSIPARFADFGQILPDQLECLLTDGTVIKPDTSLISWRWLDIYVLPHGPNQRAMLFGCPELVVEVRSASNRRIQEKRKRDLYFAHRTQIVWDVDPENQQIWVYHQQFPEDPIHLRLNDEIDCEPLLPNWRRRVADIFAVRASAEAVMGEVAVALRSEGKVAGIEIGKVAGIEIGKVAGIEIGKTEGAMEAIRAVLPMLVRVRFGGQLSDQVTMRLLRCDLGQLQQLQSAVETAASFEQWLALLNA